MRTSEANGSGGDIQQQLPQAQQQAQLQVQKQVQQLQHLQHLQQQQQQLLLLQQVAQHVAAQQAQQQQHQQQSQHEQNRQQQLLLQQQLQQQQEQEQQQQQHQQQQQQQQQRASQPQQQRKRQPYQQRGRIPFPEAPSVDVALATFRANAAASAPPAVSRVPLPKSDFKGLAWDKQQSSWRVRVSFDGRQRHVGRYKDEEEGAQAYDCAAMLLFGDAASTNFGIARAKQALPRFWSDHMAQIARLGCRYEPRLLQLAAAAAAAGPAAGQPGAQQPANSGVAAAQLAPAGAPDGGAGSALASSPLPGGSGGAPGLPLSGQAVPLAMHAGTAASAPMPNAWPIPLWPIPQLGAGQEGQPGLQPQPLPAGLQQAGGSLADGGSNSVLGPAREKRRRKKLSPEGEPGFQGGAISGYGPPEDGDWAEMQRRALAEVAVKLEAGMGGVLMPAASGASGADAPAPGALGAGGDAAAFCLQQLAGGEGQHQAGEMGMPLGDQQQNGIQGGPSDLELAVSSLCSLQKLPPRTWQPADTLAAVAAAAAAASPSGAAKQAASDGSSGGGTPGAPGAAGGEPAPDAAAPPGAIGSSGGGGAAAAAALALQGAALAQLDIRDIAPPPPDDMVAVARVGTLAFLEVERVAEALGLGLEQLDAVTGAVEAAVQRGPECHKFVGMSYKRLRRLCLAGDAAAVRNWMDMMAARFVGGAS